MPDPDRAKALALVRWSTLADVWAAYCRTGRGVIFERWMADAMGRADEDLSALERAARRGRSPG